MNTPLGDEIDRLKKCVEDLEKKLDEEQTSVRLRNVECLAALKSKIASHEAELEAVRRWQSGEEPCFSMGVCESITCGYGELDHNGYWQFPLYPASYYSDQLKLRKFNKELVAALEITADSHERLEKQRGSSSGTITANARTVLAKAKTP